MLMQSYFRCSSEGSMLHFLYNDSLIITYYTLIFLKHVLGLVKRYPFSEFRMLIFQKGIVVSVEIVDSNHTFDKFTELEVLLPEVIFCMLL